MSNVINEASMAPSYTTMSHERVLSDLVMDSKLETIITPRYTEHRFYSSGISASERQKLTTERWVRDGPDAYIGQGSFGSVYRETCLGKIRALKKIRKFKASETLDYTRELEAVMKFSHPKYAHCFVPSFGWFESSNHVFITMEYLEHGDLDKHLNQPLPEHETKQITTQVLEGLNYMHENRFAHRDLKPANIMVVVPAPEWFVKITDFGVSKRLKDATALRTNQGTTAYQAPEIILLEQGGTYTFAVDMWSLGVMVYKMMTARLALPKPIDKINYFHEHVAFPLEHLKARNVTEDGIEFIVQLMSPNPSTRPTAVSATEHSWIKPDYQDLIMTSNAES
ncbi:kinase-like domain-containing protein [Camillea tinctor]|nr:kinase-like domain-containing protein [Camillea tinctor]